MPAERSIIVAADGAPKGFLELVEKIGVVDGLGGYKVSSEVTIGMTLLEAVGIVRDLSPGAVFIYDQKIARTDILDTIVNFTRTKDRGDVAAILPFADPQVQERYTKELHDRGIKVIVDAEMTHPQQRHNKGDYRQRDAFKRMIDKAVELNVRDFMVRGNEPDKIAECVDYLNRTVGEDEYSLFGAGFTIAEAGQAAGESWHAIIGQGITEANDPSVALLEYTQQLLAA